MSMRPNFTSVLQTGGLIVVNGTSPLPTDDVLMLHIVLSQGGHSVPAVAEAVGEGWSFTISGAGFTAGPATAVGVEVRRENATTTTWVETVEIPQSD
jgi:hypothetical protein